MLVYGLTYRIALDNVKIGRSSSDSPYSGPRRTVNIDKLRVELEKLAQDNLDKATFTEKRDIIGKLGIRVYPSEDLKSVRIQSSLNFGNDDQSGPLQSVE